MAFGDCLWVGIEDKSIICEGTRTSVDNMQGIQLNVVGAQL